MAFLTIDPGNVAPSQRTYHHGHSGSTVVPTLSRLWVEAMHMVGRSRYVPHLPRLCTQQKENTMARRIAMVLMGLVLTVGGAACAPKLVGPTAGAGYVFSLQVSDPIIWLGPVDPPVAAQFPEVAELLVQVQDAQGRPVDGVPISFAVESGWVGSVSVSPSRTRTRGGRARAIVSEPQTTGVVRVMARVDNTTAQATLTVLTYERKRTD